MSLYCNWGSVFKTEGHYEQKLKKKESGTTSSLPKEQSRTRAAEKIGWDHIKGFECQTEWFITNISGCGDSRRKGRHRNGRIGVAAQEI